MASATIKRVRLGDVAMISAGQGAPQGADSYCSDGVPFIKAGNLQELASGCSEDSLQCVNEEVAKRHKLKLYKAGSVLFAKSGMSCMKGLVHVLRRDCYVVSHLAIVTTPSRDSAKYLEHYFKFHKPNELVKDAAYPSISLADISNIEIAYPPLAEQKRIAAALDKISEMKRNAEARLQKLDLLVKARFNEMFGDPLSEGGNVRLGEVASLRAGKFVSAKDIHECGDYPCYGGNGIRGWVSSYNHEGFYPLIGRQGALCGNVQLAKGRFYATEHAVVVKPIVEWHPVYMHQLLTSLKLGRLATGAAQPGLSVGKLEELLVSVAPLALQREFAALVEKVEALKATAQKELEKVDLLCRAKLQEYFG